MTVLGRSEAKGASRVEAWGAETKRNVRARPHTPIQPSCRTLRCVAVLLGVMLCLATFGGAWATLDDSEGDLHRSSMQRYSQEHPEPLRHEVLLVGDGEKMRFWPMWHFYKYLASAVLPCPFMALAAAGGRGGDRECEAGQGRVEAAKTVTLITPTTRGFRRGMACEEAVATFAHTKLPLLYFLVSPGDKPLLLSGAREYRGLKILEVEDMEGPLRLRHLILSNQIQYVVYRYFNIELLVLQELCPHVHFLHLPFFIDSSHFHLPRQERAAVTTQARVRARKTLGGGDTGRETDVLVYGNTWSHRYPLRHRVLRALTAGHIAHNLTFRVIPHPGYFLGAQDAGVAEDFWGFRADWNEVMCDHVPEAFWRAAARTEHAAAGARPACCGQRVCTRADCEVAAVRVAQGPLASCDDVHTCPGGSAWPPTGEEVAGVAEGWGLRMREQIRLLGRCVPMVRGRELGDAIRLAKIVVTDCIQGDTVYESTIEHSYLVAKYHEIAACGAVIAGNLPRSGHGSGLQDAVLELEDNMSDAHIIDALKRAVSDAALLRHKAAAGTQYFAKSSYAHGARYWSTLVASALDSWQQGAENSTVLNDGEHEQDEVSMAVAVPLPGANTSVVAMAHNPDFFADRSSQQLLAAISQTSGSSMQRVWLSDPHRALVSAALATVHHTHAPVPCCLMVEVGSGLGLTVLAAMSAGWRVLAFEALRSNLVLMQRAVLLNGWSHASATGNDLHRGGRALLHSACAGGNIGYEKGRHVCGVHAAVARCGGYPGGKVVVATLVHDQGDGHVLQEPYLEALASDEDMQDFTRAPDGSLRQGTRRPIAQALLTPICLDSALSFDAPPVPRHEEPGSASKGEQVQGSIDLLSINTGADWDTTSFYGGGGNVLAALEGAKGLLSGGRVRAVVVSVSSARTYIEAVRMLEEAGYCLAYSLCPGERTEMHRTSTTSSSEPGAREAGDDSLLLPAACKEIAAAGGHHVDIGPCSGEDGKDVALYFLRRRGAYPSSQGACDPEPRRVLSEQEGVSLTRNTHKPTSSNAHKSPDGRGREAAKGEEVDVVDGRVGARGRGRADELLRQYQELHAKIVDPDDHSVAKRFLVLRSGHGIGNTMIEEVTALLMGLATRRAVVFDSRGGGVFGLERPVHCFHRPLLLDFEVLLPVFVDPGILAEDSSVARVPGTVKAPEDSSASYARYAELLACSDWNATLGAEAWVSVEHLFGFPFAYLNEALAPLLSSSGVFGHEVFPALHAFLHRPVEYILDEARSEWQQHVSSASCSVGLQIRWHHLAEDMQVNADLDSHEGIEALERVVHLFVRTALDACSAQDDQPAGAAAAEGGWDEGGGGRRGRGVEGDIVLWVAADYRKVYGAVHEVASRMRTQGGTQVRVAHLSAQRAQGLRERPGHGSDLSGDNGEHEAALIDLEVLSACHIVVCTRLSTFGYVAHARASLLRPTRGAMARPHGTTWQCSGHSMVCKVLPHAQAGLVAAQPVHSAWPWTQERFRHLSCTSGLDEGSPGVLSPV